MKAIFYFWLCNLLLSWKLLLCSSGNVLYSAGSCDSSMCAPVNPHAIKSLTNIMTLFTFMVLPKWCSTVKVSQFALDFINKNIKLWWPIYAMSVVNSLFQFIRGEKWNLTFGYSRILPSLWWVYFKIRQKLEHFTFSSYENTPYKTNTVHQEKRKRKRKENLLSAPCGT